jgi:Flp pilus assembly protein TadD
MRNTLLTAPEKAEIYHDMGMVYSRRGEYDQARIYYMQAIVRDSTFAPPYHNLGNIQLRQGRLDQAKQLYRKALRADSTYVLSYLALGNAHMRSGQVPQAVDSYRRGLRFAPADPRLVRNLKMARQILAAGNREAP